MGPKIENKDDNLYFALGKKWIVLLATIIFTSTVYSNPVLDNVASGNVSIETPPNSPNSMTINQGSQKAIINWQSFNIGAPESVHFQQPAGGVALNRINPTQGPSSIYGRLTATGQIILVNPAGIFFGPNAYVNVGGLIATTSQISEQNFLSGNYQFVNPNTGYVGSIINQGHIVAANHGLIALVGNNVQNSGVIEANMGKVVLASGSAFTMNFDGSNLINFTVDEKAMGPTRGVTNTGTIMANGGQVMVSAKAAQNVLDNVINLEGVVQAKSVYQQNGEIILSGDADGGVVRVAAKMDVSGKGAGQKGGKVKITGNKILVDKGAEIDASGDAGGGQVLIGGNYKGQGPLPNAQATIMLADAMISADAITNGNGGEIILWGDDVTRAHGSISARGGAEGGDGGFIETSAHYLDVAGIKVDTSAPQGKTGLWLLDPWNVTVSNATPTGGGSFDGANPNVWTPSASGSTILNTDLNNLLNSTSVTITTTGIGAEAGNISIPNGVGVSWTKATILRLVADNNISINGTISGASGTLDLSAVGTITSTGLANISVANFILSSGSWSQVANPLPSFSASNSFSITSGTFLRALSGTGTAGDPYLLADVYGLQGVKTLPTTSFTLNNSITATGTSTWNSGSGFDPIGTVASPYTGTFSGGNNSITGLTISRSGTTGVGLFGYTSGATISNLTLINPTVTGNASVGSAIGRMTTGTIQNVGASGVTVTGSGGSVGGLIGEVLSSGTITEVYSNGSVTGLATAASAGLGGLIGVNLGNVVRSFSLGTVTSQGGSGTAWVGGLIGLNNQVGGGPGTITNSFSMANVIGSSSGDVGGLVGFNNNIDVITDSYSVGRVTGSAGTGGLVGFNNGTVNVTSYWNTETSGQATTGGGGGSTGVTGLTDAQMKAQANFTGFDFTTVWNIIEGVSYPFLRAFHSSTPRVVSGTASSIAGGTVTLAANGSNVTTSGLTQGTAPTFNNGGYYFLQPNGAITDGHALLAYLTSGGSANAVTFAPGSGGSLTGLNMASNTLSLGDANTNTITNANLSTAKGGLSTGILYSVSGSNLTLNSGISLTSTANTTYDLEGNITASGGGIISLSGPVELNAASVIDAGTGSVTFGNTLDSLDNQTFDLTVNSSGTTTFSGVVGTTNARAIGDLITNAAGSTNLNTTVIRTWDNQTYNDPVTLGQNIQLFSLSGGGAVTFANTLNGARTLTLGSALNSVTSNFNAAVGGGTPLTSITVFPGGVTSFGAGTVATSGAQTYDGSVALTGNTAFSGTDITFSDTISSVSSSDLTVNDTGTTTFGGAITGIGNLLIEGGLATIINTTSISSNGTQTFNTPTLLGANLTIATTDDNVIFGAELDSSIAQRNLTVNAGTGGITFSGDVGTTELALNAMSLNSTGTTTISGLLSAASIATNAGGTTALNGGTITTSGAAGQVYQVYNDNATLGANTTINANTGVVTFGGTLNSTGANRTLAINTSGLTTFSGDVGGTLPLSTFATNGAGSTAYGAITFTTTGTQTLNEGIQPSAGTTLVSTGGAINISGDVTGGGSGNTFTINNATTSTISGILDLIALTKAGTGTLVISNTANTYTGATTINAGTLQLGTAGVIPNASAVTLADVSGAIFDLNDFNETIGSIAGGGTTGGDVDLGSATLTTGGAGSTTTYSGDISGTGALTSTGGTLTLAGDNSYTGLTSITGGTLRAAHANALGTTAAGTTVSNGATLDINGVTIGTEGLTLNGTGVGGNGALTGTGTASFGGAISLATNSTFGGTGTLTLGGIISGSGINFTKVGSGTIIFNAANTYTGTTNINAGTLRLGANERISNSSSLVFADVAGAIFDLNGFSETVGSISGGGTTGGDITLGSSNNSLTSNTASSTTYAGDISGSGSAGFIKSGTGTLSLSGSLSYTGGTTINTGSTIRLLASDVLPDSSTLVIAGTLDLNNFSDTVGSLLSSGGAASITLGSGTLTSNASGSSTWAGNISGTGGFTKGVGNGVLTFSTANDYSGTTTVNDGTLLLSTASAINNSSGITVNSGGTFEVGFSSATLGNTNQITINGTGDGGSGSFGALAISGTSVTLNNNILLGSNSSIGGTGGSGTLAGIIDDGAGTFNLTKVNTGTITLSNTGNSWGGSTIIGGGGTAAGTLRLGASEVIPNASAMIVDNALSASFDLNGFTETIGSLDGDLGTVANVSLGSGTLITGGNNSSTTYNGVISGTNGNLTKAGSGVFILGGSNTYTGTTSITGGTLRLGSSNRISDSSAVTLANTAGVIFDLNGNSETIASLAGGGGTGGTVTLGSGTLTTGSTGDTTFAGVISGTNGNLIKQGSGIFTLSNANTYTGTTSVTQGTLNLTNASALGSGGTQSSSTSISSGAVLDIGFSSASLGNTNAITLNGTGISSGGALTFTGTSATLSNGMTLASDSSIGGAGSGTLSGIINDAASSFSLTKVGASNLTLSNANTYDGGTNINVGTVSIGNAAALGTGTATVASNAILNIGSSLGATITNALNLAGSGSGAGAIVNAGTNTFSGGVTLSNNTSLGVTGGSDALTFSGVINDAGSSFGLTKLGSGNLTLSNANTYDGGTSINAGTVSIGNVAALGTGTATVANNAILNIGSTLGTIVNALNITGAGSGSGVIVNAGTNTFSGAVTLSGASTIGVTGGSDSLTFSGVIDDGVGTFALTKLGAGSLTLSNANTFGGGTNVNVGTVSIGNAAALGTGTATVASNAILNIGSSLGATVTNALNVAGSGSGAGAIVNAGTNTFSGAVTLSGASTIGVTGGSDALTLSGVIDDGVGTFALTKLGAGSLSLSNANTFGGGTNINAGTVSIGNAAALGTGTATVAANAVLATSGSLGSNVTNALNLAGSGSGAGAIVNAGTNTFSGGVTLSNNTSLGVTGGSDALTFSGVINDAGSSFGLTKLGSGSLTLSNANTYDGGTAINAGTVTIGNTAALGTGTTTIASGALLNIGGSLGTIANAINVAGSGTGSGAIVNAGTNTFSNNITLADNATIGVTGGSDSLTFDNPVGDGGSGFGLTKVGSGTLTLSDVNTYGGGTTISTGTVAIGDVDSLGTGLVSISSGARLSIPSTLGTIDNIFTIGGSGIGGTGAIVAAGANTISGIMILSNNTTFGVTGGSDSLTLGGVIDDAGTFAVNKVGSGNLTLSGANTFAGGVNVNVGTVTVGATSALGSGIVSVADAAILNFAGSVGTVSNALNITGSGSGSGAIVNAGTNTLSGAVTLSGNTTLGVTGGSDVLTMSNVISESGGSRTLTKSGSGLLTLSGNNSYTGTTTISTGTLRAQHANALGTTAAGTTVASGATLDINGVAIGNEALTISGTGVGGVGALIGTGTSSLSGPVTLAADSTIGGTGNTLTLSGVIGESGGARALTKIGTGNLILGAANTYTGATNINAGTLTFGVANAIDDNSALTIAGGATLGLGGFDYTMAALSGAGNIDLGSGGADLAVGGDGSSTSYTGVISGTGTFTKDGGGTLSLGNSNTFTGDTNINAGTLRATVANALGDNNAINVAGGATYDLNDNSDTIGSLAGSGDVTLGSATLTTGGAGDTTFTGAISGTGALTKQGAGIFTLSGTNSYTGDTTVSAGTLRLGGNNILSNSTNVSVAGTLDFNGNSDTIASLAGNGNVTLGAGTLTTGGAGDTTFSGVISGTNGNLVKQGAGIFTLSGANTYTGDTAVNAGTLRLGGNNILSNSTDVTVAGTLDFNGNSDTIASLAGNGNVTLGAGTITTGTNDSTFSGVISGTNGNLVKQGAGIFTLSGANTYTGATSISAGTLRLGAANVLSNSTAVTLANAANTVFDLNNFNETIASLAGGGSTGGNVALGTATLTTGSAGDTTYAGVISGTGGLTKVGAGNFTLSGVNTYTGATNLNAGTLTFGVSNAINSGLTIATGATLGLGGFDYTMSDLSGDGNIALGAGNLTVGDATSNTYSGVISGTGSVTKTGAGTLTLDSANTYSGVTNINQGMVIVENAGGLGTTAGGTTVGSGATLRLANVPIGNEAITLNNSTLESTGTSSLSGDINLGTGTDTINSAVALTLSGTINGSSGANFVTSGLGTITISGSLGSSSARIGSTNFSAGTSIDGSIYTSGDQAYASAVNVGQDKTYDSLGAITFNNTINGGNAFTVNGTTVNFNGAVGGGTALSSLMVDADTINIGSGSIRTSGNQTYMGAVALGADTTFTTTGSSPTVTFNNGISGNKNVTLAGGASSNETYMLSGSIAANNVTVSGGGGTDTLQVNSGTTQSWNITADNTGNISGVSGVAGNFTYDNIQNLTGGSSGNNTFTFSDGARITGNIDGGSLSNTNTLNFAAFTNPVNVTLSSTNNGTVSSNGLGTVTAFTNMTDLVNNNLMNTITLPGKNNSVVVTSAKNGFINDPIFFNGFQRFIGSGNDRVSLPAGAIVNASTGEVIVNGVSMFFLGFSLTSTPTAVVTPTTSLLNVADIIEPINNLPEETSITTSWTMTTSVTQNISDMIKAIEEDYDRALSKVKINPYCYKAN